MISPSDLRLFRDLAGGGRRFVLTTHMNPDGDAIGSQLALARFLVARGLEVHIVNQDPTPFTMTFLEGEAARVRVYDPPADDPAIAAADTVVLLDNSAPDRLGAMEGVMRASSERVLCIDHHPTRVTPWKHNILDEEACATAAMVYELILDDGWAFDLPTAEALFVGVATDTGFFRFNSTTPRAFEIGAELMRAGVEPARCYREIYERNSAEYTRLLGGALAGLRLDSDGAVASMRLTREMVARYGAEGVDPSEMTTPLLAMDRVRIAILFREVDADRIKVSLRSKGGLDVRLLATEFGGGGHRSASGIVMAGGLDEVTEKVLRRASALAATVR